MKKLFVTCTYCKGKGKVEQTPRTALGYRLQSLREEKGLTQGELAERIGLTRTSVTNMEAGRQNITVNLLYKIADELSVKVNDFFI